MREIEKLRQGRAEAEARIREAMLDVAYEMRTKSSRRILSQKLEQALWEVNREDVFKEIESCAKGNRCSSLWCLFCRNSASDASREKIERRIKEKNYSNTDLLHVTIPVGLAPFNAAGVIEQIESDNLRWKRIRKKHRFWFEGTYEFELVDMVALRNSNGCTVKKKQMAQLIAHQRFSDRQFIFVHIHGVTDVTKGDLEEIFGENYFLGADRLTKTASCGLYVQEFRQDQTLEHNVRKVASYPFKSVYRFKHSYRGSDHSNGEFLSLEELGKLVALYHDVQGRQWRTLRRNSKGD